MADLAWACRTTRANQAVIASENPNFDKAQFDKWLVDHDESGYFIRDPYSPFDCRYIVEFLFHQMYAFEANDEGQLFRQIKSIA